MSFEICCFTKVATGFVSLARPMVIASDLEMVVETLDRKVRIWTSAGELLHELAGHQQLVFATRFSPSGKVIASSGKDDIIIL